MREIEFIAETTGILGEREISVRVDACAGYTYTVEKIISVSIGFLSVLLFIFPVVMLTSLQ